MADKNKKKVLTMDELAKKAKVFLKGKELNPNGKQLFDQVIKNASNRKPHGSK